MGRDPFPMPSRKTEEKKIEWRMLAAVVKEATGTWSSRSSAGSRHEGERLPDGKFQKTAS